MRGFAKTLPVRVMVMVRVTVMVRVIFLWLGLGNRLRLDHVVPFERCDVVWCSASNLWCLMCHDVMLLPSG